MIFSLFSTSNKQKTEFLCTVLKIYSFEERKSLYAVSTDDNEPRGEFWSITELPLTEYLSLELCFIQRRTARKSAMIAMKMTISAETSIQRTVAKNNYLKKMKTILVI